ncbi:hypothetical protein Bhyg_03557 [Pseudolycoriella hygida]|uniref:Uncharacterized protein n=1 Tax=Pseudolycoriella hygida TaxID=35572 RepID=A0A9Q0NDM1_9DIPT|nr:hypothetical protein Bhyg_03557 [Pseudolycoriella hygida]
MGTLNFQFGDKFYLLFNLSDESVRQLENDQQNLKIYAEECLRSGMNICLLEDKKKKFSFLCGKFEKEKYIYAVKFETHPWHYFHELESIAAEHSALPPSIHHLIEELNMGEVRTISLNLGESQWKNYFTNGQFHFKNKKLETRETNPLIFLQQFEKCYKSDKDKMYGIRGFTDESHKAEFSRLYFTSDWPTVKSTFLRLYSMTFAHNQKKELKVDFNDETSLRSFVQLKLAALSRFTTLPLINQMEIILSELPVEISSLFLTSEKLTCSESEILEFCDSINDLAESLFEATEDIVDKTDEESPHALNKMKIFSNTRATGQQSEDQLSESEPMSVDEVQQNSRARGRRRGRTLSGIKKKARPTRKAKLKSISESSTYDFLDEMDDTTRSTWSDDLELQLL